MTAAAQRPLPAFTTLARGIEIKTLEGVALTPSSAPAQSQLKNAESAIDPSSLNHLSKETQ